MRIITPPTSTLLLDPEEVLERLKLPESETAAIERLVKRVSAIVAGELKFQPWYQRVEQDFDSECGGVSLNLTGRPFVRLESIAAGEDDPLVEGEDFAIRLTGRLSGEAWLHRPEGWDVFPGFDVAPDWTANYWHGWWLPKMTGEKPADVATLPEDLAEATYIVCRDRRVSDGVNPAIASMGKGSARIEFRRQGLIPSEAADILLKYIPIVTGS